MTDPGPEPPPAAPAGGDEQVRLTARVAGSVQGVGFRWWTRARALELALTGSATNLPGGGVEVVAQGPRAACARLLALLEAGAGPGSTTHVAHWWGPARADVLGFAER